MGNFLYNVNKSREEWLKKPNHIPTRARYLNANLNTSLVQEAQVTQVSRVSELKIETETIVESESETIVESETE